MKNKLLIKLFVTCLGMQVTFSQCANCCYQIELHKLETNNHTLRNLHGGIFPDAIDSMVELHKILLSDLLDVNVQIKFSNDKQLNAYASNKAEPGFDGTVTLNDGLFIEGPTISNTMIAQVLAHEFGHIIQYKLVYF